MADRASASPRKLSIKKYPNRRYYDSTQSRHLTLEQLHALICDGYEIAVTDSKTGQDITAKVLAQLIIELDPPKMGVFPAALLHQVLRSNERVVGEFVEKYFTRPLSAFFESQRHVESAFRAAMGLDAGTPSAAEWARRMWGPFAGGFAPVVPPPVPAPVASPLPPDPAPSAASELHREIERLRSELEQARRGGVPSAENDAANAINASPRPRRRRGGSRRKG
jgi:polyhydroxyalkanoate synthesis repressor PhaR